MRSNALTRIAAVFFVMMTAISCLPFELPFPNSPSIQPVTTLSDSIIIFAEASATQCSADDNLPRIRQPLNLLIDSLAAMTPFTTQEQKLPLIIGPWQQLWTDTQFSNFPFTCFRNGASYQVVYEDGFYWNISEFELFGTQELTLFLRGEYQMGEPFLPVGFTRWFIKEGNLTPGDDLVELGLRAENGEIPAVNDLDAEIPVFFFGQLGNYYVDEQLRIVTDGGPAADSDGIFVQRRVSVVQ